MNEIVKKPMTGNREKKKYPIDRNVLFEPSFINVNIETNINKNTGNHMIGFAGSTVHLG
jgi:hypothetical protein